MIRQFLPALLISLAASHFATAQSSGNVSASDWPDHGGDYRERRFSTLTDINSSNVEQLGLAWHFETDSAEGMQATPIVVDGVMYVTGPWSIVYALDAATGAEMWRYDPQVPRATSYKYCCGAVNRGVAVWDGRVYAGTLDGRLIAVSAASGELLWQQQTTDTSKPYSITGAPRIANGKVIIGNGGAEYGVRGYVSAYDGMSGEQLWRFYTVPGNPADGFENEQMAMAAKTWTGEWWQYGGGGTVWDSIAFDPELNLLYLGVGNGSPHNQQIRSPEGGDNLFLTSIVALNPDTGDYVWHYQQVNGETWDYTATQQMVLLDIDWQGKATKVIMQAPKAGFFYIIDRLTGKLLSAEPFVKVNWANGYDLSTGRAIENPEARYKDGAKALVFPTGLGGHNWHSMSYSPDTGLMYIPAQDFGAEFEAEDNFVFQARHWNVGYKTNGPPGGQQLNQALLSHVPDGFLLAWDPIKQQEVWRASHKFIGNGGAMATAGNLVFQGTVDGSFNAYRASDGKLLWSFPAQNGIIAAPVSYRVGDQQYVSVAVGRGGGMSMILGIDFPKPVPNSRILTFKISGDASLPPLGDYTVPAPPPQTADADVALGNGMHLYNRYCARCHGVNAVSDGSVPDLRHLQSSWHDNFDQVVRGGLMADAGMPRFDDVLSEQDARDVQNYLILRANEDFVLQRNYGRWDMLKEWVFEKYAKLLRWLMTKA